MKNALILFSLAALAVSQTPTNTNGTWTQNGVPSPPSPYWVHGAVTVHAMSAALDAASSWKQGEGNTLYADKTGPWTGHFYREGAGRMAAITGGIILVSEVVGIIKPKWRKYIATFNFVGAAVHVGVTTSNVIRNPYYRN